MSLLDHAYWSLTLTALTTFALGLFVLWKNPRHLTNRTFAFFSGCVGWWSFWQSRIMVTTNPVTALWISRVMHGSVVFIATAYYHFVLSLTDQVAQRRRLLRFCYLFSFAFLALIPSPLFVAQPTPKFYLLNYANPGPLYRWVFLPIWIAIAVWALAEVFQASRRSPRDKSNQLKYVFVAFVIGYGGGVSNYAWLLDYNPYPWTPYGTYGVVLYPVILAYAILKHHLMDINIVIRKSIIYSVLIGCITALYFGVVYLLSLSFGSTIQALSGMRSVAVTLVALILIALLFKPTERRIQKFLDRTFFKDTAEAIARENERLRAEMVRAEQMKTVSLLASGMAHEIKNPLTAVKTFVEHLEEKHQDPEFRAKFRRIVSTEIDKINNTVRQLLTFARPQTTQFTDVKLSQVLDETLDLLSNDLIYKRIHVERHYDGADTIHGDATQLKQAFLNLFLNSADAMPNGGRLAVTTSGVNGSVSVTIADTGSGIQQHMLDKMFEPFVTTKPSGTGLGLSVVHQIIKDHNAQIAVDSRLHAGTQFTLTFQRRTHEPS